VDAPDSATSLDSSGEAGRCDACPGRIIRNKKRKGTARKHRERGVKPSEA
jgi:hypothetical protein